MKRRISSVSQFGITCLIRSLTAVNVHVRLKVMFECCCESSEVRRKQEISLKFFTRFTKVELFCFTIVFEQDKMTWGSVQNIFIQILQTTSDL